MTPSTAYQAAGGTPAHFHTGNLGLDLDGALQEVLTIGHDMLMEAMMSSSALSLATNSLAVASLSDVDDATVVDHFGEGLRWSDKVHGFHTPRFDGVWIGTGVADQEGLAEGVPHNALVKDSHLPVFETLALDFPSSLALSAPISLPMFASFIDVLPAQPFGEMKHANKLLGELTAQELVNPSPHELLPWLQDTLSVASFEVGSIATSMTIDAFAQALDPDALLRPVRHLGGPTAPLAVDVDGLALSYPMSQAPGGTSFVMSFDHSALDGRRSPRADGCCR